MKLLTLLNKVVFGINVLSATLLLISVVIPHVSLAHFPGMAFLGLSVPVLVIAHLFFVLYWLLQGKRQLFLSLVSLLLGYLFLESFFRFDLSQDTIEETDLSIMSYNARIFNRFGWHADALLDDRIVGFVRGQNPDVVCFQEFDYPKRTEFDQYPHRYVALMKGKVIQAIFSKYPIVSKGHLDFKKSTNNGIYADIVYQGDTLRIYNLHLQSLKLRPGSIVREPLGNLFNRLNGAFQKQLEQTAVFDVHRNASPYKNIVCGDFNNTQFSRAYNRIKGEMSDTFEEKGSGFGRTYEFVGFPGRIDFILVDPGFEVTAHKNFDVALSDHYPIMASVRLQGK
ncbi:endonuclease/exonuclease/phosphatase family protein [Spongiimicrobium sp. 2-473A-2-J]|uniref:endonuclease/exonuclease/phosphatase family protein n=1 Tax=Eudoraea algarum TaxID=3417568 RepID=UPI003D362F7B